MPPIHAYSPFFLPPPTNDVDYGVNFPDLSPVECVFVDPSPLSQQSSGLIVPRSSERSPTLPPAFFPTGQIRMSIILFWYRIHFFLFFLHCTCEFPVRCNVQSLYGSVGSFSPREYSILPDGFPHPHQHVSLATPHTFLFFYHSLTTRHYTMNGFN